MTTSALTTCPHCNADVEDGALFCVHCGEAIPIVTPASDSYIGRTVARNYRIVKQIARGGMGVVYLARHEELGQRVAVKFLHRRFADDEELAARFFNEARAASKVAHPYAVSIYDFSRLDDGTLFIVMEYVEGKPLHELIRVHGRLDARVAVPIAIQACQVLDVAHENKLVHRDVKPDNIMVIEGRDKNLTIKMLDFGIAKILDGDASAGLTQTGMMFGTPEYMSPEQASGAQVDHRSDVYSLGLVLYEMLVGQPPFRGRNKMALLQRHIRETPTPVERACPSPLPRGLAKVVAQALAKDADARPQSMAEFAQLLQEIDEGQGRSTRPRISKPVLTHDPENVPSEPYADAASAIGVRETEYRLGEGPTGESHDQFDLGLGSAVPSAGYSFGEVDHDFDDERVTARPPVVRSGRGALPVMLVIVATVVGAALVLRAIDKSAAGRAADLEGSGELALVVAEGSAAPQQGAEPDAAASAELAEASAGDAAEPAAEPAGEQAAGPGASEPSAAEPSSERPRPPANVRADAAPSASARLQQARAAIREGDLQEANAIAAELEALDQGADDVHALRRELNEIARLRREIDAYLGDEDCIRADEKVVQLRGISRSLAISYYGRLDACRAARRAARASTGSAGSAGSGPSSGGSTGSEGRSGGGGRVLPPSEL